MMQNWKHELEELLYHLGIYLSQDGYPVIVRQQTWCSRSGERLRRLMTGVYLRLLRLHSGQRGTQPPHHSLSPPGKPTRPLPENGHEKITSHPRQEIAWCGITCSGLVGKLSHWHRARSRAGPKFFF